MLMFLILALGSLSAHAASLNLPDHVPRHNSPSPPANPFTLTPAFTIDLQLTSFPPQIQPPDSDGTVGVQPVASGTISGPLLNGTITSGIGHASRFATYYLDDDLSYGQTDDGFEFILHFTGVGNSIGKVDRLEITIGGKYAYLSESFLIQATETNVTAAGGTLHGEIYLVGSTLQSFP